MPIEPDLDEIPSQVRIRCGKENAKRYRDIYRLKHITGRNKTASILTAVRYYNRMAGVESEGSIERLMKAAVEKGSLTPSEIAAILDSPELPVAHESRTRVREDWRAWDL